MSICTHVTGMIRVNRFNLLEGDLFRARTKEGTKILRDILGPIAVYEQDLDSDRKVSSRNYDRCKLPKGTEGSLQYNIVSKPLVGISDSYMISIWGDLRDYDLSDVSDDLCIWFYNFQREISNHESRELRIVDAILNVTISTGERITFFKGE